MWKGMPDKIRVVNLADRVDSSRRVATQMKDSQPANAAETRARIRVSARANREIVNRMKVVLKKAEPREAVNAVRTSKFRTQQKT
jgi:hypothetical protein